RRQPRKHGYDLDLSTIVAYPNLVCTTPQSSSTILELNSLSTKPQTQIRRSYELPKMATAGGISKFAPKPKIVLAGCGAMRLNSSEVSDMAENAITTRIEGELAYLILNRPEKRNAINQAMLRAIPAALDELDRPEVRAIILYGEGQAFAAGIDFTSLSNDSGAR